LFSFVRLILFIPSKCPEQLMMSDKSGTFALLPSPQSLMARGEEKARVRVRQRE
jgi:hypothetical protein